MEHQLIVSNRYSSFIKGQTADHNKEILEATDYLLHVLLEEARKNGTLFDFRLTETIHSKGINCRYLGKKKKRKVQSKFAEELPEGLLRNQVTNEDARMLLLVEIVARVIKNNLRLRLRMKSEILRQPLEEPYRRLLIDYFNMIFGNTPHSEAYWNTHLKIDIQRNFIMVRSFFLSFRLFCIFIC